MTDLLPFIALSVIAGFAAMTYALIMHGIIKSYKNLIKCKDDLIDTYNREYIKVGLDRLDRDAFIELRTHNVPRPAVAVGQVDAVQWNLFNMDDRDTMTLCPEDCIIQRDMMTRSYTFLSATHIISRPVRIHAHVLRRIYVPDYTARLSEETLGDAWTPSEAMQQKALPRLRDYTALEMVGDVLRVPLNYDQEAAATLRQSLENMRGVASVTVQGTPLEEFVPTRDPPCTYTIIEPNGDRYVTQELPDEWQNNLTLEGVEETETHYNYTYRRNTVDILPNAQIRDMAGRWRLGVGDGAVNRVSVDRGLTWVEHAPPAPSELASLEVPISKPRGRAVKFRKK